MDGMSAICGRLSAAQSAGKWAAISNRPGGL